VTKVLRDGDRVDGLVVSSGQAVAARHYVDASGHCGLLRRAMNVPVDCPTRLKNIAFWDYWENAEWAVSIGTGGTLVQVLSLGHGWIWFIPLGPTRTSIGFICPAAYFKQSGKPPEQVYAEAVRAEPRVMQLTAGAVREGRLRTTSDWSFLAERTAGSNWFLVGESAGFADPVLSAGLTLAHNAGREAAYTILELDRGDLDPAWLRACYDLNQRRRIGQHIRFADFFYAANGQFTDLQEHCQAIARDAGLDLSPDAAWQWLAWGGFTNEVVGLPAISGFDLGSAKQVTQLITKDEARWRINDYNRFRLNLSGAVEECVPNYAAGRIVAVPCYQRAGSRLPITGMFGLVVQILRGASDMESIIRDFLQVSTGKLSGPDIAVAVKQTLQVLEVLVDEGWVEAWLDPSLPRLQVFTPDEGLVPAVAARPVV
jgi:hypothetical protein